MLRPLGHRPDLRDRFRRIVELTERWTRRRVVQVPFDYFIQADGEIFLPGHHDRPWLRRQDMRLGSPESCLHELCHYLVAKPWERRRPNLSLDKAGKRADRRETETCILEIELCRAAGVRLLPSIHATSPEGTLRGLGYEPPGPLSLFWGVLYKLEKEYGGSAFQEIVAALRG